MLTFTVEQDWASRKCWWWPFASKLRKARYAAIEIGAQHYAAQGGLPPDGLVLIYQGARFTVRVRDGRVDVEE